MKWGYSEKQKPKGLGKAKFGDIIDNIVFVCDAFYAKILWSVKEWPLQVFEKL